MRFTTTILSVAFYVLSEDKTRHAQMTGQQAKVAGTVNGQPKTVALIRGVQFKGEIRRLEGEESDARAALQSPLSGCRCAKSAGVGNPP
jgi:uncharacterized protein YhbP (UPF0306 family)